MASTAPICHGLALGWPAVRGVVRGVWRSPAEVPAVVCVSRCDTVQIQPTAGSGGVTADENMPTSVMADDGGVFDIVSFQGIVIVIHVTSLGLLWGKP